MFYTKRFYPRTFISSEKVPLFAVDALATEAKSLDPSAFDASVLCFDFHLRYVPPYEEFNELQRLQKEALRNTRFRTNYNGFIELDISEWDGHQGEEYFKVSLDFLRFMLPHWYYIFVVSTQALSLAVQEHIRCAQFPSYRELAPQQLITHHLTQRNVIVDRDMVDFASNILSEVSPESISAILDDYLIFIGSSPSSKELFRAYLNDSKTLAGDILQFQIEERE